jgi:hypothetical protein
MVIIIQDIITTITITTISTDTGHISIIDQRFVTTILLPIITIAIHMVTTTVIKSTEESQLDIILRHIDNVRDSCLLLGQRLIAKGELQVGRMLIANGYIHDNSKLYGIEWLYLNDETFEKEPEKFKLAWQQHVLTNKHHPEFWPGGIDEMPREYKAEFVADCHARSSEFGTDLREWIKTKAAKKFKMNHSGRTYKEIKELLDLLLERKFE